MGSLFGFVIKFKRAPQAFENLGTVKAALVAFALALALALPLQADARDDDPGDTVVEGF